MKASAPKRPWIGFHSRPVRKPKPNSRIEGTEAEAVATIIAPTISSSTSALVKTRTRKTASPRLPVGASTRHQCDTRKSAPYSEAGPGVAVDIKKSGVWSLESGVGTENYFLTP